MQQKLALARTLLHQPKLILLDEPTAGLDVVAAAAIRDDLEALVAQQGVTVFLTTHNMTEAERLCDAVAVIKDGKMLDVGSPDDLRARASGPRLDVFGSGFSREVVALMQTHPGVVGAAARNGHLTIDMKQDVDAASLVNLLVGAGAQVEEVRRSKASLEEVFLTLVEEKV
jgi:ABC-2 type transport system ATP-binding protein